MMLRAAKGHKQHMLNAQLEGKEMSISVVAKLFYAQIFITRNMIFNNFESYKVQNKNMEKIGLGCTKNKKLLSSLSFYR